MRDYILLYINGQRRQIRSEQAFMTLAEYLRREERLTGTKIVCAEGDCGSCSVLRSMPGVDGERPSFEVINSCIAFVHLMDCSHIITIEAIADGTELHPVQKALADHHGTQCGYCTPGFVMSLVDLFEKKKTVTEQEVKNQLVGNLCRCTGYRPIIEAALHVDTDKIRSLHERFDSRAIFDDLRRHANIPVRLSVGAKVYYAPTVLSEALRLKRDCEDIHLFAGGTDLGVSCNKERLFPRQILSLRHISELKEIKKDAETILVGASVTLASLRRFVKSEIPEFSRLLNVFASPQIKNAATLAGNVANGSPIGDTLPFLFVTGAKLEVAGKAGLRFVEISDLYSGYRKLNLTADEIIVRIHIPIPPKTALLKLYKVARRKDLDISAVTAAFLFEFDGEKVRKAHIAYGGVGPVVLRLKEVEDFFTGRQIDEQTIEIAAEMVRKIIRPISDVRGGEEYRKTVAANLMRKLQGEIKSEVMS
jgi:xanthine dehydrogenase small subunit